MIDEETQRQIRREAGIPEEYSIGEATWLDPKDFYSPLRSDGKGDINKIDASHLAILIPRGADGLLQHIIDAHTKKPIKYQHYLGEKIPTDGHHRLYAAFLLGIPKVPTVEFILVDEAEPGEQLVYIKEWDVLPKDQFKAYMQQLEDETDALTE
ncbi:MAG: hypothetical protein WC595_05205 [Candidatus Nanoarchaeia archaeon]